MNNTEYLTGSLLAAGNLNGDINIFFLVLNILVVVVLLGIPVYVIYLNIIKPPNRAKYIEINEQMKECFWDNNIPQHMKDLLPHEFLRALTACVVVSVSLSELFEENVAVQYEIETKVKEGILGLIIVHTSGLFRCGVGLYAEINRLIRHEWKPNIKKVRNLSKTIDFDDIDPTLLDIYNNLDTVDDQIRAIKKWRRLKKMELWKEEGKKFRKRAAITVLGSIVLAVVMYGFFKSHMSGFGTYPNPPENP